MTMTLEEIRGVLTDNLGKRVTLTTNAGRSKIIEKKGILKETYRSVFVIELDKDIFEYDTCSCSYRDLLTDDVEITFFTDENEPIPQLEL